MVTKYQQNTSSSQLTVCMQITYVQRFARERYPWLFQLVDVAGMLTQKSSRHLILDLCGIHLDLPTGSAVIPVQFYLVALFYQELAWYVLTRYESQAAFQECHVPDLTNFFCDVWKQVNCVQISVHLYCSVDDMCHLSNSPSLSYSFPFFHPFSPLICFKVNTMGQSTQFMLMLIKYPCFVIFEGSRCSSKDVSQLPLQ